MDLPFFLLDEAVVYACESGSVAALGVAAVGAFSSGGGGGGGGAGGGGGGGFWKAHYDNLFWRATDGSSKPRVS